MKPEDQHDSRSPRSSSPGPLRYAGIGLELAASIVGLTLVGYWVDWKFGTDPVGLITGACLGIVGGFYNFIRQALRMMKEEQASSSTRPRRGGGNDADRR